MNPVRLGNGEKVIEIHIDGRYISAFIVENDERQRISIDGATVDDVQEFARELGKVVTVVKREQRKRRNKRNQYRNTVCVGCRHSRYNFESDGDGWNAPTTGEGCYHLAEVKRGKCWLKS